MKLSNRSSERETVAITTPSTSMKQSQSQQLETRTSAREKSVDIKDSKEKQKQEKLEKKEKERLEKERKEREKKEKERLEKERKEREKAAKKGNVSSSATTNDINKLSNEQSTSNPTIPTSKSENLLSRLTKKSDNKVNEKKQTSIQQQMQPQQPPIPKGRFRCQVIYLDESVKTFDLDKNAIGDDLFNLICQDLELVEKEYFSLTYRDYNNMKFWLEHDKKIKNQLKGNITTAEPVFNFEVKFYPPEPNVLQEEITRYLLTLQLRHDIMDGKLPCSFVTQALLGSYTVQAELGDYDEVANMNNSQNINGLTGIEYLDGFCFSPTQTPELLLSIAECHKDHKGQTPGDAEMHFLENAVKLAMYGVDLHNAKDSDGIDILIGVSASGLLVFRDHLRINRFAWPKILKISYKRNHFYLKLRPGEFEKYETTIGFRCPNHKAAKRLWKIAVEHHAFFRLREPEKPTKSGILPNFNSKFRYTGSSTYMQSRTRSIERNQPSFTRSLSKRLTQSVDRDLGIQSDTPGSVQAAAFNHYNKNKSYKSTSNIPNREEIEFRESQEDLALEADYNLNDSANRFNQQNYQPPQQQQQQQQQQPQPSQPQNQPQQQYSNRTADLPRFGDNYVNTNRINTNNNSVSNSIRQQSIGEGSQQNSQRLPNMSGFGQVQLTPIQPINDSNSYGQEDYYTSVDDRRVINTDGSNRTPSTNTKQSYSENQFKNNSSTPIIDSLNKNRQQQPQPQVQSQRYVPSRTILTEQQPQPPVDNSRNNSFMSQPPISPRTNTNFQNDKFEEASLNDSVFSATRPANSSYLSSTANRVRFEQPKYELNKQPQASQQAQQQSSLSTSYNKTSNYVNNDNLLLSKPNIEYSTAIKITTQNDTRANNANNMYYNDTGKIVLNSKKNENAENVSITHIDDEDEYYEEFEEYHEKTEHVTKELKKYEQNVLISVAESEPVPFKKSTSYGLGQDQLNTSLRGGFSATGSASSFRNQERIETSTPSVQGSFNAPQPSIRSTISQQVTNNRPIPADRTSVNSRSGGSINKQLEEKELDNQRALIEQREYELQQLKQQQQQQQQRLREQQMERLRQATSSTSSLQQPNQREFTSRNTSITSTPDASRSMSNKKMVSNEQNISHEDLLLNAIRMATNLDPNLKVEKVEMTSERINLN